MDLPYRKIPANKCRGNEGNKKLSLWDNSNNCHRQDSPIDAKSKRRKFKEKLGIWIIFKVSSPTYLLLKGNSYFIVEKSFRYQLNQAIKLDITSNKTYCHNVERSTCAKRRIALI